MDEMMAAGLGRDKEEREREREEREKGVRKKERKKERKKRKRSMLETLKLHHPQKPVAYARVFGLLGLGSRCGGRKEEQQGKFIRDLGCRSWGAEKRAGGECSCGGCAESCRGVDGRCDAMRCDAMRCDVMRCDAM